MQKKINVIENSDQLYEWRNRNCEKWFPIVQDFLLSRKSQVSYCLENNIKPRILQYWLTKFKNESSRFVSVVHQELTNTVSEIEVAQVQTVDKNIMSSRLCTLELGNGKNLIIESQSALLELKSILKAIL